MELELKKRVIRALVMRPGKSFTEECDLAVTNSGSALFQLLCLAMLLSRRNDYRPAVAGVRHLREQGWTSARQMAGATDGERAEVLRRSGYVRDSAELARAFGELAREVLARYRGDLRRLRSEAKRNPRRERQLLRRLPGMDDEATDIFLREVQPLWPEVAPYADKRALLAARKLGLGRTAEDLAHIAGGGGPSRLAWVAGALARVEVDRRYDEIRELAGMSAKAPVAGPDQTSPRRIPGRKRQA